MDKLFQDLNSITKRKSASSVHLTDFPESKSLDIDVNLERQMGLAQNVTSLALSLRKKEGIIIEEKKDINKI